MHKEDTNKLKRIQPVCTQPLSCPTVDITTREHPSSPPCCPSKNVLQATSRHKALCKGKPKLSGKSQTQTLQHTMCALYGRAVDHSVHSEMH